MHDASQMSTNLTGGIWSKFVAIPRAVRAPATCQKIHGRIPNGSRDDLEGYLHGLTDLTALRIRRCLLVKGKQIDTVSLRTFADASEVAYGAVVYARYCYQDGSISTNIVAAKTRLAPSKATSIPRLELMGAVTGVRLSTRIIKVLELQASQSTFWSDSLNVLWWIRGHSRDFKPFVANRVGEIQTYTSQEQWKYVPTDLNPADILSRGIKAAELVECERWWGGTEFLHQSETAWPSRNLHDRHTGYDEMKGSIRLKKEHSRLQETIDNSSTSTFVAVSDENIRLPLNPSDYSSWLRLKRILAWINCFVGNCSKRREKKTSGEFLGAEKQLILSTQVPEFYKEYTALSRRKPMSSDRKLLGLNPRIDDDGIMRSDGRLKNAKFLSYDVRHPVILARKSWVTKLTVREYHEDGNHATGTNQTLAALSTRYWIHQAGKSYASWKRSVQNVDVESQSHVNRLWHLYQLRDWKGHSRHSLNLQLIS